MTTAEEEERPKEEPSFVLAIDHNPLWPYHAIMVTAGMCVYMDSHSKLIQPFSEVHNIALRDVGSQNTNKGELWPATQLISRTFTGRRRRITTTI